MCVCLCIWIYFHLLLSVTLSTSMWINDLFNKKHTSSINFFSTFGISQRSSRNCRLFDFGCIAYAGAYIEMYKCVCVYRVMQAKRQQQQQQRRIQNYEHNQKLTRSTIRTIDALRFFFSPSKQSSLRYGSHLLLIISVTSWFVMIYFIVCCCASFGRFLLFWFCLQWALFLPSSSMIFVFRSLRWHIIVCVYMGYLACARTIIFFASADQK